MNWIEAVETWNTELWARGKYRGHDSAFGGSHWFGISGANWKQRGCSWVVTYWLYHLWSFHIQVGISGLDSLEARPFYGNTFTLFSLIHLFCSSRIQSQTEFHWTYRVSVLLLYLWYDNLLCLYVGVFFKLRVLVCILFEFRFMVFLFFI